MLEYNAIFPGLRTSAEWRCFTIMESILDSEKIGVKNKIYN